MKSWSDEGYHWEEWVKAGRGTPIRYSGPVLSGRMSLELALLLARKWGAGERYLRVEDYDPVLRAHVFGEGGGGGS